MQEKPTPSLQDLVNHLGSYPEAAFLFTRNGLGYAANKVHGTETEAHRYLYEYLASKELDWSDLVAQYESGSLPGPIMRAIEAAGGCEKLNRHVGGRDLCWGLRDYALDQWGLLARVVLASWNITSTRDFGRIVFGFIDFDLMQKQAEDRLEDFEDVFSFEEALDEGFRLRLESGGNGGSTCA